MRKLIPTVLILLIPATGFTAARLTYELQNGPTALAWSPGAFPIPIAVGSRAAQGQLGEALIRSAFDVWQNVEAGGVSFSNAGVTDAAAGRDGVNLVTVSDKLFDSSGLLAFTTTWFDEKTGQLLEVDIQIDPAAAREAVGLQTIVQHEIGHLLGFDHSGVVSSVMYPWVAPEDQAGLDSDDKIALTALYPGNPGKQGAGTIRGEVRLPGGGVFGAQVVAVDIHGAAVASTLSDANGVFLLDGLPAGEYRLYAEPLDGPVEQKNLAGIWRATPFTKFRTEFTGPVRVSGGGEVSGVEIRVTDIPDDLNPRWIGVFSPGSTEIRLSSTVATITAGREIAVAVGGDGIVGGLTEFEVLNPGFTRTGNFRFGPNYLWATFRVDKNAEPGSVVIVVRNGGVQAALTGAIRVVKPAGSSRGRLVGR
ncbi:MAG: matrixin family metalloprotease [Thermoanaerobaculia bacterium]